MADAVKNSGRTRRPPSHLREDYHEDNFDPNNPQLSRTREPYKQGADPCSLPAMGRLLVKFLGSVNKKFNESQAKKAEIEATLSAKKHAAEGQKYSSKNDRSSKEDRQNSSSKFQNSADVKQSSIANPSFKPKTGTTGQPAAGDQKQGKNQIKSIEASIKNTIGAGNLNSIESMAKMSREQLLKMMPKGYDSNMFKQPFKMGPEVSTGRNVSKGVEVKDKGIGRPNQLRSEAKLFKRAAFHVGLAYKIHIQNVKQRNPNFTPQQIDPTYISRKMKMDSLQNERRNQQAQKERQEQQRLRQRQATIMSMQGQLNNNNKPTFINIEDDEQDNGIKAKDQKANKLNDQKPKTQEVIDTHKSKQQMIDEKKNAEQNIALVPQNLHMDEQQSKIKQNQQNQEINK